MEPVFLEGMKEIGKPKSMTDEQCFSVGAFVGVDDAGFNYFCTAWKPGVLSNFTFKTITHHAR